MQPRDGHPVAARGDILLISPPFASIDRPSLGLHIVQSIARQSGLKADVYYATVHAAAHLGEARYADVAFSAPLHLLGERVFSAAAFPDAVFGSELYAAAEPSLAADVALEKWSAIEAACSDWMTAFDDVIRSTRFTVYGFTSMFAQNTAAIALARRVRALKPEATIILGGANADGEMAAALADIAPVFDHIFSGESEVTFRDFCLALKDRKGGGKTVITGKPFDNLNALANPDYTDFFTQMQAWLPDSPQLSQISLSYETSRGCWWGQKNHCTFCGLNANGMAFRRKDAGKVVDDLQSLTAQFGNRPIAMTDNIMPVNYFTELLPRLEGRGYRIFYEQKSNLKPAQLDALKRAGVMAIQPGIEALSSSLLKRMRKGVAARQNVRLLRQCRQIGIEVVWNLLYGFPGEAADDYAAMPEMLGKLVHLAPPSGFSKVSFDRFSPYFDRAADYGIRDLRPHANYDHIYPAGAPLAKLAYHFHGDAETIDVLDPALAQRIQDGVQAWIVRWREGDKPMLMLVRSETGQALVIDTRKADAPQVTPVSDDMATLITGESDGTVAETKEAVGRDWAVYLDGQVVGLVTTSSTEVGGAM